MSSPKYKVLQLLAEGGFGDIFYVKQGKDVYALKQLKYRGKIENDPYILGEINSLSELKHENIIALHDVIITSQEVNIIMEFADGGNLEDCIKNNGIPSESLIRDFFRQILFGVKYCHDKGYAHRDLTPSNILVTGKRIIKLADFGLTVKARDSSGKIILCDDYLGNNSYLSPEILKRKLFDPLPSDVWSLGITLYFLTKGKEPYKGTMEDVLYQQEHNVLFSEKLSRSLSDFDIIIINILHKIPSDRPSVKDIISDLILTQQPIVNAEIRFPSVSPKCIESEMSDNLFSRQV